MWFLQKIIIQMEKLFQNFMVSRATIMMDDLNAANFQSNRYTCIQEIERIISKQINSQKWPEIMQKVLKNLSNTPQTLLKKAIFIHLSLRFSSTKNIIVQHINTLLRESDCLLLNQFASSEICLTDNGKEGRSPGLNQISTREDQQPFGRQKFFISQIFHPFSRYVLRLWSLQQSGDLQKVTNSCEAAWAVINLLRGITALSKCFNTIGRYFMRQFGGMVLMLVEAISRDLCMLLSKLRKFIISKNQELSFEAKQHQLQEFLGMLEEIGKLNEGLMQIYLGKYFLRSLKIYQNHNGQIQIAANLMESLEPSEEIQKKINNDIKFYDIYGLSVIIQAWGYQQQFVLQYHIRCFHVQF